MEGSAKDAQAAERPRRPKSIRAIFLLTMVLFAALATGGALTLAVYNVRFDRMFETAMLERSHARMMVEIRVNLLLYNRAILLLATTGEPKHRTTADQAQSQVWFWLNAAKLSMTHVEDAATLQSMDDRLQAYFRRREELLKTDLSPARQSEQTTVEFDEIIAIATDYLMGADQEQKELQVEINQLNRWLTNLSLIATFVLPFAFLWMVLEVNRSVFLPFRRLRASLEAYSSGDREVRAPVRGPAELQDMASSFNELADQLQRQKESRYEFLLGVAHDLRNPLTALKGHTALAARQLEKGETDGIGLQDRYTKISILVNRLDRLVADLVDVTRIEAGRFDLQLSPCSVSELLQEVIALYDGSSIDHPIKLDLPPEEVFVRCDPARMSQVLINLVSNAIKYSPEGGEISLRVRQRDAEVAIEVEDQGIGIAPEELPMIFQPFHRVAPGIAPGAGLGLSVALGLVEAQGGRIEVESAPGAGSTFRIVLAKESATAKA